MMRTVESKLQKLADERCLIKMCSSLRCNRPKADSKQQRVLFIQLKLLPSLIFYFKSPSFLVSASLPKSELLRGDTCVHLELVYICLAYNKVRFSVVCLHF